MGRKNQLVDKDEDEDVHRSRLPNFTNSPLITSKKMKMPSKKTRNNNLSSSDSAFINLNRTSYDPAAKFNLSSSLGSLMAAPNPTYPSPSPSSAFRCDYSRDSADFYTPTGQGSSVISRNMSFKKQSEQSPKCLSISTIYESAKDHVYTRGGFDSHGNPIRNHTYSPKSLPSSVPRHDYEESPSSSTTSPGHPGGLFPILSSVPEETMPANRKRGNPDQFARAIPVSSEQDRDGEHHTPVNRPKPYQEFLDEVQKHRRNAEHSAREKAVYTHLLDKLRKKENAIDVWELNQRSKQETKLEKTEKKFENKRAKALQKMHRKFAEISMESERKKARERRAFLKKMDTLSGQSRTRNKVKATMMFWNTWSCCWHSVSHESP